MPCAILPNIVPEPATVINVGCFILQNALFGCMHFASETVPFSGVLFDS